MFGTVECRQRMNVTVDSYDSKLELTIFPKTKGRELFDRVVQALDVAADAAYFGISCTRFDGNQAWLEDNKEIYQQRFQRTDPVVFFFKYKLFPADVGTVESETSLKILYLQTREAILSGRVFLPRATAVELASYAAQIKFGSSSLVGCSTDYLRNDKWVPASVQKDSRDRVHQRQLREAIASMHKQHYGKTIAESMRAYLVLAQQLSTYGLVEFQASVRVGDEKKKCCVGVTPCDVRLYEGNEKAPTKSFLFKDVASCSLNENRVKMKLKGYLTEPDFEIVSKQASAIYDLCQGYLRLHKGLKITKPDGGGGIKKTDDRKLEEALSQEVEARERAQQETERLKERQSLMVDRLRDVERENETLRQKVHFLEDRISVWKKQLMHNDDDHNLVYKPNGDASIPKTDEPSTSASTSRLPKPTPARRSHSCIGDGPRLSGSPSTEDGKRISVSSSRSRLPTLLK